MTPVQASTTAVQTYQIDKTHSEVAFQIRHVFTKVRGRFQDFSGMIRFDQEQPENSSVSLTITVASIDTVNADRDEHLRSSDFFDVNVYPTIRFTSSGVVRRSEDSYAVMGVLTIRGISREITLPVTYLGAAIDPWVTMRAGFETAITLNRKDYGLDWNMPLQIGGFLLGDDVQITLSIEAIAE
jgi:polyisoprenoid-binding protein YceI